MIKILKEHIGFHYLLIEIQLYTLILLELNVFLKDKSINTHNIFTIQDNDYIICGFYCITFTEYMLAGKHLLNYTNLFSLNNYKKNDKII